MSQDQNINSELYNKYNNTNIISNPQEAPNGEGETVNINMVAKKTNQKKRITWRRRAVKGEVTTKQSTLGQTNLRKRKRGVKKEKNNPEKRPDNIRRSAFIRLLIFLKIFFEKK